MLKLNEANWDRIFRVVLGAILFYLGGAGIVAGALGVILLIIGVILLITGFIGFCPIYALFKTGTKS